MNNISRSFLPPRNAIHMLYASVLLIGLWPASSAHAEEKLNLIEMPLIKKFKADKAAAAAEAATAAASGPAHKESGAKTVVAEQTKPTTSPLTQKHSGAKASTAEEPASTTSGPASSESVKQLRQALTAIGTPSKQPAEKTGTATHGGAATHAATQHVGAQPSAASEDVHSSRQFIRARALALARGEALPQQHKKEEHTGEVHWAYEGENGPLAWGKLKPEFNLCAIGKRQSPIAIQNDATLHGPAEAVQFKYRPSNGTVVNNGHTIQVDVEGDNSITVRNSSYKLLQFHFHTPSEEMINSKRYAMVAHLVHKNDAGQLAVVAVLLEQGEPNTLIDKVWTYMPLDTNDRVRMPDGLIDMNEVLPADQRYYQFMGSLTTPPCTEGVLWMVIKQPLRISAAQFKVFSQQFPNNARPVQPVNSRPVREAQ